MKITALFFTVQMLKLPRFLFPVLFLRLSLFLRPVLFLQLSLFPVPQNQKTPVVDLPHRRHPMVVLVYKYGHEKLNNL